MRKILKYLGISILALLVLSLISGATSGSTASTARLLVFLILMAVGIPLTFNEKIFKSRNTPKSK